MSDARREILERVARATAQSHASLSIPRTYRKRGTLSEEARVDLFCRRTGEYQADVRRIAGGDVGSECARICRERAVRTLLVPQALPDGWLPPTVELVEDHGLTARELDGIDGTLTGCTIAIAETGTIVLSGRVDEGRRAITLVPDLHICVVRETQIVELVPEAFAVLARDELERRPLTLISGPSATSDIELSRVEGVHGPRSLYVLVARAD